MRLHPVRVALLIGIACLPRVASAQFVDYAALQATVGEPVTTSVTGKPQRASDAPAATVIITAEQIAVSPARDVPGLLKSYAGVDVNRWGAGQTDVAVRGGVQTYNARLLVLVDGRQVYLDHYGMTDWNLLGVQLEDIQQIELVRGPASALFGFNAVSGVVNIVTKRSSTAPSVRAAASAGDHGFSRLAGSASLPLTPDVGIRVTAGRLREDERRVPVDLLVPANVRDVSADQVSGEVTGRFDRTGIVLGGGYAANEQVEYLPSQLLSNQRFHSSNVHAALAQDTAWGGLSASGYVNWLDADYGVESAVGQPTAARLRNRIVVGKASGLYRVSSRDTLRLGVEFRNNRLRSAAQFSDTVAYDVLSGDAMIDLHPGDAVTLTGAARLDRLWLRQSGTIAQPAFDDPRAFDRAYTRLGVNAALLVRVGATGQLRVNGGRGYQLPSLVNLSFRLPIVTTSPVPIFVAGSPTIAPVRLWSAEIGYADSLGPVRVDATAFYNRTHHAIASPGDGLQGNLELFAAPSPILVARFRGIGDYTTYGMELSAGGTVAALRWRTNYTWTRTDGDLAGTALPIPYALSPRSTTSQHKANVELGYDARRWYITGVARYTSAARQFAFSTTPQLLLYPVDAAVALDARLGYRVTARLELFAAGENLSLADGAAGSPIPADRRLRAGVRLSI